MLWIVLPLLVAARASYAVERNDSKCAEEKLKGLPLSPECGWHYIAYFPRQFRTNIYENILVSTHGYEKPVNVKVELLDVSANDKIFQEAQAQIEPGVLTPVPVYVAHRAPDHVKVRISGSSTGNEWSFSNTSNQIAVERLGLNIFIQTDRPLYKPGEKIRCRVLVVDSYLKPENGILDQVVIENPSGSRMVQWNNVTLEEGFAAFELQLSEKPVLGSWKIKVGTLGYKKELDIEVKKYVLPKFQVVITPPSYVVKMHKEITAEVCAKYSYGKPVVGKLSAKVCRKQEWYYYLADKENDKVKCVKIEKQIDGCTQLVVKSEDIDMNVGPHYYYSKLVEIEASVKELATGVEMNATKTQTSVQSKEVVLSFEQQETFKPGFPLHVKLYAKYPDGKPIPRVLVNVSVAAGGVSGDLFKEEVLVQGGEAKIDVPDIPFNSQNIRASATYSRPKMTPNEPDYERESYGSLFIKPWYSPSHSYLLIEKPKAPFKIGEIADVKVSYTSVDAEEKTRTVYYSMICAGVVAASGYIDTVFSAAVPVHTTPSATTTPSTTAPATTTDASEALSNNSAQNGTISLLSRPYVMPWWRREFVTRPPLPSQFSSSSFFLRVHITKTMLPSCQMVAYYIRDEETVADNVEIDVEDVFENDVSIKFARDEVKPGETTTLTVTGYPGSRIAIAAVDKSVHFLAAGNDLKQKELLDVRQQLNIPRGWVNDWQRCPQHEWGKRKRRDIYYGGYSDYVDSETAFVVSGVEVLTSLRYDVRPCLALQPILQKSGDTNVDAVLSFTGRGGTSEKSEPRTEAKPQARPRTEFPETWLWTEERLSLTDGAKVFEVKVPDTITTWYASGFAVSKVAGLGVAKPVELKAFQPFFVSLTLPYSVIRGEEVTVPAAVFSYLENACITVRVSLAFSKDYVMIAGPSAKSCICGGRTATVLFRIRPRVLGQVTIRVSAETLKENDCAAGKKFDPSVSAADILVKKLRVDPEGLPRDYSYSSFFCPKNSPGGVYRDDVKLKVPQDLVPGSMFAKVTIVGDIMGPSLSNLDQLLAMPYGCGEQNMLKFAPNIFIMNYLKSTNQVTEEIRNKALGYMRSGYQRELTYKHPDGSYSAFGPGSENGSTWLTAFVLKSYAQARPWIDIDGKEIEHSRSFLISNQDADGCFPQLGSVHSKAMKGGVQTPVTLSAYVAISLLEADINSSDSRLASAAKCVGPYISTVNDSYSLAIFAYMFAKMRLQDKYDATMKRLDEMAVKVDGMTHWEEAKKAEESPKGWWWYQASSSDIEQTAYVLLALLENKGSSAVNEAVPIVRWLSKQRNSLGGWASTQDTVLAMQALAVFAQYAYSSEGTALSVDITTAQSVHTFDVNKDNQLVLQRVEGLPVPSAVLVQAKGSGCGLLQVTMNYNILPKQEQPSFELTVATSFMPGSLAQKSCLSQKMSVCAKWLLEGESNMAIVNVQMVSGFEADKESLDLALQYVKGLKDVEYKGKDVVMYFNKLDSTFRCVKFIVHQTSTVRKTKPATVSVYDYYDTGKAASSMYKFTQEQCEGKA